MMRSASLASLLYLAGCGPSAAEYEEAIKRNWPNEQASQRDRGIFFARHAAKFEDSAKFSADIAARLGESSDVSDGALRAARKSRAEQAEADFLGNAEFVDARDVSFASAAPLPGENCEATITIKGADGKKHELPGAWRFDRLDGRIAVVGSVAR